MSHLAHRNESCRMYKRVTVHTEQALRGLTHRVSTARSSTQLDHAESH